MLKSRPILRWLITIIALISSAPQSSATGRGESALPLLSDLAYYQLKTHLRAKLTTQLITIPSGYQLDFDELQLDLAGTRVPVHFTWQDTRTISFTSPLPYLHEFIVAYRQGRKLWQLPPTHPTTDFHLSALSWIQPFKRFRGYLVFADAYPRTTVDFSEAHAKENAVFIRGIDHRLGTRLLYFTEGLNSTPKSFVPERHALKLDMVGLQLFYTAGGYEGRRIKLNQLQGRVRSFHPPAEHPPATASHPCLFHPSPGHQLTLSQPQPHLITLAAQASPCPALSAYLEHLWHGTAATSAPTMRPITITLTPQLTEYFRTQPIRSFALSSSPPHAPSFKVLLIKTSANHSFTQKNIPDDVVLVLEPSGRIDGAFFITTHHYSPRHNVSFLPTPQAYMNHLATQQGT